MVASGKFGISGTKIRGIFDGKWVKTIVLTNPIRLASQGAARADGPASTSQDGATLLGTAPEPHLEEREIRRL